MKYARISALALVAALAVGGVATAQQGPAQRPAMANRGWDPAAMQQRMEARRAARLKALHDVLGIRPEQEGAFAAYAAATRRPERTPGEHQQGMMGGDRAAMAAMTTPQRLDAMSHRMDERSARWHEAFERRAAATKALYASLRPEQQQAMDALPALRGGRGRGGWGKGRGMGGHGWGGRGMGGPDGQG